jgi:hypothetical protein
MMFITIQFIFAAQHLYKPFLTYLHCQKYLQFYVYQLRGIWIITTSLENILARITTFLKFKGNRFIALFLNLHKLNSTVYVLSLSGFYFLIYLWHSFVLWHAACCSLLILTSLWYSNMLLYHNPVYIGGNLTDFSVWN